MAKAEWKDVSTWSRGDKDRTPKCWELRLDKLRIIVHRHRFSSPETWLVSCYEIGVENIELSSTDIEHAKQDALAYVSGYLRARLDSVDVAMYRAIKEKSS